MRRFPRKTEPLSRWLTHNNIQGNAIGVDVTGLTPLPNVIGVYLQNSSNQVGGSQSLGNVISGNSAYNVAMAFTTGNENKIQGNKIGNDRTGTAAIGTTLFGVRITEGSDNLIGGDLEIQRNLISGNETGVLLVFESAVGNEIRGNYIGLNDDGDAALANSGNGVRIVQGANNTLIRENYISGNDGSAVSTDSEAAIGTMVLNNRIGYGISDQIIDNGSGGALRLQAPDSFVDGNFIYSGAVAVLTFGGGHRQQILDNIIEGNGSTSIGVQILGTDSHVVNDNFLQDQGTGLLIASSLGNSLDGNIFSDTTVDIDADFLTPTTPQLMSATSTGTTLEITYEIDDDVFLPIYPLRLELYLADDTLISSFYFYDVQDVGTIVTDSRDLGVDYSGESLKIRAVDLQGNASGFSDLLLIT